MRVFSDNRIGRVCQSDLATRLLSQRWDAAPPGLLSTLQCRGPASASISTPISRARLHGVEFGWYGSGRDSTTSASVERAVSCSFLRPMRHVKHVLPHFAPITPDLDPLNRDRTCG